MMLMPDQVKPLLLHENANVRQSAGWYFSQVYSRDPSIPKLIFEAIDRYGEEAAPLLSPCSDLLIDDESLQAVLNLLNRSENPDDLGDLREILGRTPIDVLLRHEDSVKKALGHLSPYAAQRLHNRKRFAALPLSELRELLENAAEDDLSRMLDDDRLADLISEIALRDEPSNEEICRDLVEFEEEDDVPPIALALMEIAGRRRACEAIPTLIRWLHHDEELIADMASDALGRIGGLEVVRRIEADWPEAQTQFRSLARFSLGCIKLPESEAALIRFLESETDLELRTLLCGDLCSLFSEKGIEPVRRQIKEGYDESYKPLEDQLLTVLDALGIDIPEAAEWRATADERAARAEFDLGFDHGDDEDVDPEFRRHFLQTKEMLLRGEPFPDLSFDDNEPLLRTQEALSPSKYEEVVNPIRYESGHVGRNDPCPCGSGRKFKKCCGKS